MTALDLTDTIAAVATPTHGGWRGLLRLTGPRAFELARQGFDPEWLNSPIRPERRDGRLTIAGLSRSLAASISCWPGSKTYTGQPLVEIQTTGSPPILRTVLASLLDRGARLAEPGEFTLRAFLAGRIDLTQAEAVLGVIDAQDPAQLDVALRQLAGGLTTPLTRVRDDLVDCLAHLEANLDFADEADVDPLGRVALARSLDRQAGQVAALVEQLAGRVRADERTRVVLVGPPNAGKSRLFNALIGSDQALVSPEAGTTRDYLESPCNCNGFIVDLVDTAGVERGNSPITNQAQVAQVGQTRVADLLLVCRTADGSEHERISPAQSVPSILVVTKADLASPRTNRSDACCPEVVTSATTGQGVTQLRAEIARHLRGSTSAGLAASVASTAARSGESLTSAARSLQAASAAVEFDLGDELVALDLRQAIDDLGRVVGAIVTDDLLDRIFSRFCIGK